MTETRFRSGMLVFPNLTQLDLTGPYEVLARLSGTETLLLWKTLEPVRSEHGLTILPMATFESCPPLDLLLVPGGAGINPLLEDAEVLAFVRRAAAGARYVVAVCTGSLVLGAAGLLRGKRATTHWMSRDLLRAFGAEPVAERVVVDGNLFTGGGVTAGIDVGLTVAAEIAGRAAAEAIQLGIEYDPTPPFASGSPERADPAVLNVVLARAEPRQRDRAERVARAAAALSRQAG
jgi:cyclohexyl-isocyanide hydratase